MIKLHDQIGNLLKLKTIPMRIISLVPSQTELLYDLGLTDCVVGITKFCIHPPHWRKEKQIVGGTKQQRIELIKELKPDLIIANKEENEKSFINQMQEFCPVYVSDIHDLHSCLSMITDIGKLTDRTNEAMEIVNQISTNFTNLKSIKSNLSVAYCIWKDPWMWAGKDTFINEMLSHCGFTNIINHDRYPEIEIADVIHEIPDVILLSSEPFPFQKKHIEAIKSQYENTNIRIVDGEMFSWYGSRLIKAPQYFISLIDQLETKFS